MATSNPFKVNDRVYVYPAGWGSINQSGIDTCEIDFDGGPIQKIDWRLASFTEYDPIKGGLSHERPKDERNEHPKSIIRKMLKEALVTSLEIERHPGNVVTLNVALLESSGDSSKACKSHERQKTSAIDAINEISNAARQLIDRRLKRKLAKDDDGTYKNIPTAYEQKALDFIEQKLSEGYKLTVDYVSVEGLVDEVQVSLTFRKG